MGRGEGAEWPRSLAYHCAGSLGDEDGGPWMPFCSTSCCLCCHVLAGTILLGTQCLIFNAVVLLVLLSALADPDQYHFSSSGLGGDFELMDDANMCIAIAISVLLVLIWAMAAHGACRQHVSRTIPLFCYHIFGFALKSLYLFIQIPSRNIHNSSVQFSPSVVSDSL